MNEQLHSSSRRLIDSRIEHASLGVLIDAAALLQPLDELSLRRLKKRRLALRDLIERLERDCAPNELA